MNIKLHGWLAQYAVLTILFVAGCRDTTSPPTNNGSILTGPTLLVPVGAVRSPRGITVDARGGIWVSDMQSDLVRRFGSSGTLRDSIPGIPLPTNMGFDKSTGNVLVVANNTTIYRIDTLTMNVNIVSVLTSSSIDTSSVYDVNLDTLRPQAINNINLLGDVDGAPNGDVWVNIFANGDKNFVVRVAAGSAKAMAYSSAPASPSDIGPKFLAVDTFGDVFTAFVTGANPGSSRVRVYRVTPINITGSRPMTEPIISGGSRGAGIDIGGVLFIADTPIQKMVIVSTDRESTLEALIVPPVPGMSEPAPTDISVGTDGSVYVAIEDLFSTPGQPGAVLKYGRAP